LCVPFRTGEGLGVRAAFGVSPNARYHVRQLPIPNYRADRMTSQYDYDLIVIGSGPAGEKGAAQAAYFGKKVALIERAPHLGGAGINAGTVPSKTLRETALYFSGLRQRGLYGIDYSLKDNLTVGDFMYRKQIVVESEGGIIQRNLDRHHIEAI